MITTAIMITSLVGPHAALGLRHQVVLGRAPDERDGLYIIHTTNSNNNNNECIYIYIYIYM